MATTSITIDSQWVGALERYVEGLQAETLDRAERAVANLHARVQNRARILPGWSDLADQIQVWSKDGQLFIGVNDQAFTSQAFALEYGDEVRPPTAMLRTLTEEVRAAGSMMRQQSGDMNYGVTW